MLTPLLALTAAIAIGTPSAEPLVELSLGALRPSPDLALHLRDPGRGAATGLGLDPTARSRAGGPICSGDVCQPVVSVPGFEQDAGWRGRRTELFVSLLTRAHVEPIASMAWALLATGLRLDWSPPIFDGNAGARGWGSVVVGLRLRIDAQGGVVVPPRPR